MLIFKINFFTIPEFRFTPKNLRRRLSRWPEPSDGWDRTQLRRRLQVSGWESGSGISGISPFMIFIFLCSPNNMSICFQIWWLFIEIGSKLKKTHLQTLKQAHSYLNWLNLTFAHSDQCSATSFFTFQLKIPTIGCVVPHKKDDLAFLDELNIQWNVWSTFTL